MCRKMVLRTPLSLQIIRYLFSLLRISKLSECMCVPMQGEEHVNIVDIPTVKVHVRLDFHEVKFQDTFHSKLMLYHGRDCQEVGISRFSRIAHSNTRIRPGRYESCQLRVNNYIIGWFKIY